MKQVVLARWLKVAIAGLAVCLLFFCGTMVPSLGSFAADYLKGEYDRCFWPWLGFVWFCCLPCFGALGVAYRIAANIGRDRSFCRENGVLLRWISRLAAWDALAFFCGNVILLVMNMSHPGILLFSLPVSFGGVAIAIAFAALSLLVFRAAELQDQSDLTI